jgi:pyrrolysyl-tRNA synthetase, C-terminal region
VKIFNLGDELMSYKWTESQLKRLNELGIEDLKAEMEFETKEERDSAYKDFNIELVTKAKNELNEYREKIKRPSLVVLQEKLAKALTEKGFIQVNTPIIISKKLLNKMSIDDDHPLSKQVFWVDNNKCMRPMLAPNLYYVSKDLMRLWKDTIGIFEIGSCFRKESQGGNHLSEFTMINVVEWGTDLDKRNDRLKEIAKIILDVAEIKGFTFEEEESVVYGDTVDVMYNDVELASGAMGPHFLDIKWEINNSWVGIGFGLERLLMIRDKKQNVHSVGKSLSYIGGIRLNL